MEATGNTPSLFDVVKQFDQIKVDDYQRTYAWSKDEVGELFDDLKDCVESNENHFFGTLIFQSSSNALATIVDGQQRLTTVFILVAALRDEIDKLGPGMDTLPKTADRRFPIRVIDKAWEFLYSDLEEGKQRFESNRFLAPIMKKSVYEPQPNQVKIAKQDTPITLAFRKAVNEIRELLRSDLEKHHSPEEKLARINDFLDAIRNRFLVLRVITNSLSESLEIFLTLNNRGLPLGPSDLVRGQIMALLSHGESEREQAAIHRRIFDEWKEISDNVKDAEVFLRHYLVAHSTGPVQKKRVFKHVDDRLNDASADGRKLKAKAFWQELIDASEIYHQVICPSMGGDSQYYLEMLNGLLKSHRIFALTLSKSGLSISEREETLRLVYVLSFKWIMAGNNAQILENFFQTLGNNLRESGSFDETRAKLVKTINEIKLDVEKYLAEEGDSDFIGKAVLHAINRRLAPGANPIALNSDLHLEHIAPQTETDGWIGDVFNGQVELAPEYPSLISQIGNLTLLDFKLNMQAKQLPFLEKKAKYDKSTMKITRDLLEVGSWDQAKIEARTEWVAYAFGILFDSTRNNDPIETFGSWLNSKNSN